MSTTFMQAARLLFTSESVTEGHPDKVCDQISDAVVDWSIGQDPHARVACESFAKSDDEHDWIGVCGEATPLPSAEVVRDLVRTTLRRIGYTDRKYGTSDDADIEVRMTGQSADIAQGVDDALETRGTDETDVGAGDQGMMIGFACTETPEMMPMPIALSHQLCRELAAARKSGELPFLGPDGKSQVTIEYRRGQPTRVVTVVISSQHDEGTSQTTIREGVIERVIRPVLGDWWQTPEPTVHVNPTGSFVIGGPRGDCGLTGRKIIVDTYGGMARHGGGAFSGKDPTKVDRSAAYAARYVAKNIVAAGLADRFELQLAYAIGVADPISIMGETFGTGTVEDGTIVDLIRRHFDLRPGAIIRDLQLRRAIYEPTAAYGHFGRDDLDAPWEATDKAESLRLDAGIQQPVREVAAVAAGS
ncbi:MAG: methionine adenosyltransferase [Dehalococcoidia bacterium]|nr:methionine adenosyltransferase [Dehalococcoidia bacterium]